MVLIKGKRSDFPEDIQASEGETLTLGQIKEGISTFNPTTLDFGYSSESGFDSHIKIIEMIVSGNNIYLVGKKHTPLNKKHRSIVFRYLLDRKVFYYQSAQSLKDLNMPDDYNVYLTLKRDFSNRGAHILIDLKTIGYNFIVSCAELERVDTGEKTKEEMILSHREGLVSVWGYLEAVDSQKD